MIDFSPEAPTDAIQPGMRLLRTPTKEKLEAVITSAQLVGTWTHFHNKRTIPHDSVFCEPCQANNPKRWHAWVGIYLPRLKELAIFEMTAQATQPLKKYFEAEKTLRGARVTAWRPASTPNGRVVIRIERWASTLDELPPEFDLLGALYTIWGLRQVRPPMQSAADRMTGVLEHAHKDRRNGSHE